MVTKKKFIGLFAMIVLSSLAGCATDLSSNSYEEGVVGETQKVDYGTVVDAQVVRIKAQSGIGGLAGAGAGAVGGSFIGGSSARGNALGAIGGAVIGGVAGHAADKALNSQNAMRYIIRLDESQNINETAIKSNAGKTAISLSKQVAKTISIVQGFKKGDVVLKVGDRVMVLGGGTDRARVIPLAA